MKRIRRDDRRQKRRNQKIEAYKQWDENILYMRLSCMYLQCFCLLSSFLLTSSTTHTLTSSIGLHPSSSTNISKEGVFEERGRRKKKDRREKEEEERRTG